MYEFLRWYGKALQDRQLDSLAPNKPVITSWDSHKADHNLQVLLQKHNGKMTQAAKAFINMYLRPFAIKSELGLFEFHDKNVGKLVDKMRKTKFLTIARIPEILLGGKMTEIINNDGHRTDSLTVFLTIEKQIEFKTAYKTIKVLAKIKVGVNGNDNYLPYYLGAAKFDGMKKSEHLPRSRVFVSDDTTARRYQFTSSRSLAKANHLVNRQAQKAHILALETHILTKT